MRDWNGFVRIAGYGFFAGIGFLLAQEVWWFITGLAEICHG